MVIEQLLELVMFTQITHIFWTGVLFTLSLVKMSGFDNKSSYVCVNYWQLITFKISDINCLMYIK